MLSRSMGLNAINQHTLEAFSPIAPSRPERCPGQLPASAGALLPRGACHHGRNTCFIQVHCYSPRPSGVSNLLFTRRYWWLKNERRHGGSPFWSSCPLWTEITLVGIPVGYRVEAIVHCKAWRLVRSFMSLQRPCHDRNIQFWVLGGWVSFAANTKIKRRPKCNALSSFEDLGS